MPKIREILASTSPQQDITVSGWVRTRRDAKAFSFIEINDGSCLGNIQAIADADLPTYDQVKLLATGASVQLKGDLVASQGKNQNWELLVKEVQMLGAAPDDYPLQKKGHSMEFLREIAHLRPRSNLFGAVFRTRSRLSFAIHQFFQERGFVHVHTPIITTSDCEGAGEMFRLAPMSDGSEFFGKPASLTVSGQLEAETFATALGDVYTFGPTFRAENSNTSRHASEFWMVEPEMAFCDLEGDMKVAEEFIRHLVQFTLDDCADDLEIFNRFVEKGLIDRLQKLADQKFIRLPYREAVEILEKSGQDFENPVAFGLNLQSEHERFLTEEHFKAPVTVFNYPKTIKPFYMRANDDGETVTAMDLLVPGIGEIIGGSQREERLEILEKNMAQHGLDPAEYQWYADLRKYGTVPHAGFGLGFERLIMYVTGMANIRDVIPFARTPGHCEF